MVNSFRTTVASFNLEDAATLLALSQRQVYRLLAKAQAADMRHVLHGNRGRGPANELDEELLVKVLILVKERDRGVNDLHLQELRHREQMMMVKSQQVSIHLRAEY